MKVNVLVGLMAVAWSALAQRVGRDGAGVHSSVPLPGARPGLGHRAQGPFPFFYGDYYPGYSDYAPAPSVVVVQPPPPPVYVMVPPPPPAQLEIREYRMPAEAPQPSSADDAPAFAIVLKDGSVHSAIAVTVQEDSLYYVEPDGRPRLVPLDALDREATRRANRERKLVLQLPPSTH